jgi:cysteine-rich repeat protein
MSGSRHEWKMWKGHFLLLLLVSCRSVVPSTADDLDEHETGSTSLDGDVGPAETGPAETGPAETGPAETGLAETGPAETGPAETGLAETGPAETGPAETGLAETGPAETGPAETGPAETGPAETGPAETGPAETDPSSTGLSGIGTDGTNGTSGTSSLDTDETGLETVCGDGIVEGDESCDDEGESVDCNDDCTPAICGDGVINVTAEEQCDDGAPSASCDDDCSSVVCGDGTHNALAGEQCDGTDLDGASCEGEGFDGGVLGCSSSCLVDVSGCFVCGDGIVGPGEPCDGANLDGGTCESVGFDAGALSCQADCSGFDTSSCIMLLCGDGIIEGAETCDGVDLSGSDCFDLGFDGGTLGCQADCATYDTSACITFSCGNDMVEGMETCDGTDLEGSSCIGQGFDGGTLACAAGCGTYDTSGCFVCGDGVAEGPEFCDGVDVGGSTCVAQGFDSGMLGCMADCSAYDTSGCFVCGDGVAEGPEACDGADLLGSDCTDPGFDSGTLACDASCAFDTSNCTGCGDGVIGGTEQCEGADLNGETCITQGFVFGVLGCGSGCAFNASNCVDSTNEIEPNDDGAVAVATNDFSAADANGPFTTDTLIAAAINPVGDDDVFTVSNPEPGYAVLSLETYGPIPGACDLPTNTVIEVRTSTNMLITSNDEGGINSCSLINNLILLPGITIYVRVIDLGDNTMIPAYHLHVRIDPVFCGDGVVGPGEQCDDGGLVSGDGCSATCVAEAAIQEIEPNATGAQADATGIVVSGTTLLGGMIGAIGDLDRFRVELAAPQVIRFETFSAVGVCNGITTTLRVFNAAGVQLITDTTTGISACSAITFPLPAGTFYVQVEEAGNNGVIPTYMLEVAFQGDAGVETEANEDPLTASLNISGASNVYVFGDHTMNVDSDYYAITVPVSGSSVRAEVFEGDRAIETCESNGIDSRLALYDAAGVELANDDDAGRGYCSLIDGTGTTPLHVGAHNLAAGTYYAQVRASAFAQASAAGQFIYRLSVTVRQP